MKEREWTSWTYQARQELTFEDDEVEDSDIAPEEKDLTNEEILEEELKKKYLYMFLCSKFKNGGKLSSHLWFFRGFCETLTPKYCTLLDCGLETSPWAIWKFFQSMECEPVIGGVCGYMGLRIERVYDD